jgi:hypothetical protein
MDEHFDRAFPRITSYIEATKHLSLLSLPILTRYPPAFSTGEAFALF